MAAAVAMGAGAWAVWAYIRRHGRCQGLAMEEVLWMSSGVCVGRGGLGVRPQREGRRAGAVG